MGPVSFESLEPVATRAEALDQAGRLTAAGMRVVSIVEAGTGTPPHYRLVLRSSDVERAREVLSRR